MDLTEIAAKEASALVQHVERDLAELTKCLAAAAAKERDGAVARVTAERDAAVTHATTERDAAIARVTADARAAGEALRAEIAGRITENTMTTAALAEARSQADGLRAALESVEALLATARTELIASKRVH